MRLLHIPALETAQERHQLIRVEQVEGVVRRDIDPAQTANGMVVIVISLLMAATQTGADGIDQVVGDVEMVCTPPPGRRPDPTREPIRET